MITSDKSLGLFVLEQDRSEFFEEPRVTIRDLAIDMEVEQQTFCWINVRDETLFQKSTMDHKNQESHSVDDLITKIQTIINTMVTDSEVFNNDGRGA